MNLQMFLFFVNGISAVMVGYVQYGLHTDAIVHEYLLLTCYLCTVYTAMSLKSTVFQMSEIDSFNNYVCP